MTMLSLKLSRALAGGRADPPPPADRAALLVTLLRKPEAVSMPVDVKYVGWDIPDEFVVGYGLDFNEKYRNLRDISTLAPHIYS